MTALFALGLLSGMSFRIGRPQDLSSHARYSQSASLSHDVALAGKQCRSRLIPLGSTAAA